MARARLRSGARHPRPTTFPASGDRSTVERTPAKRTAGPLPRIAPAAWRRPVRRPAEHLPLIARIAQVQRAAADAPSQEWADAARTVVWGGCGS